MTREQKHKLKVAIRSAVFERDEARDAFIEAELKLRALREQRDADLDRIEAERKPDNGKPRKNYYAGRETARIER